MVDFIVCSEEAVVVAIVVVVVETALFKFTSHELSLFQFKSNKL